MQTAITPHIRQVERFEGGLVVTFSDGASLFYSAELLRATMPFANDLGPDEATDQDCWPYL